MSGMKVLPHVNVQGVTMKWRTRLTALQEQMMILQQPNVATATSVDKQGNTTSTMTDALTLSSSAYDCIPIMSAPMAGHAGGKLAATVCHAGGIGMIGAGHWLSDAMNPSDSSVPNNSNNNQNDNNNSNKKTGLELLHDEITVFQEYNQSLAPHTKYPLCIGFIGHSTFANKQTTTTTTIPSTNDNNHATNDDDENNEGGGWRRLEYVIQTYQPTMIQFFAPAISYRDNGGESNIQLVHRCSNDTTKVFVQVGTVAEAMEAVTGNNIDGMIVQGSEAGGHGVRREMGSGTLSLVANVIHRIRGPLYNTNVTHTNDNASNDDDNITGIPILAAGGIVDGTTMAAVMALGCDGVVIGTRFWASLESIGSSNAKQTLVTTPSCDDIVRTTTFDWIQNTYSKTPWPIPYDSVGAIKNDTYYQWENRSNELASVLLHQKDDDDDTNDIRSLYQSACQDGNTDIAVVLAGEGIGQIHSIESAHTIVHTISHDAMTVIQNLSRSIVCVQQPVTTDTNQ